MDLAGQEAPAFQVAELIEAFRVQAKTGVLKLFHGAQRGVVYIVNGCPIDATLSADSSALYPGQMVPAEALREILAWDSPSFALRYDPKIADRPARITEDGANATGLGLHTPVQVTGAAPTGILLDKASLMVLARIEAGEGLAAIARDLDPSGSLVLSSAAELLHAGLIEPALASLPWPELLHHHALLVQMDTLEDLELIAA